MEGDAEQVVEERVLAGQGAPLGRSLGSDVEMPWGIWAKVKNMNLVAPICIIMGFSPTVYSSLGSTRTKGKDTGKQLLKSDKMTNHVATGKEDGPEGAENLGKMG